MKSSNDRLSECTICKDCPNFSLKENRSCIYVSTQRDCRCIKVDGNLDDEITPNRCDYCIQDYKNGDCLFVELKGSDWRHAVTQIETTVKWFKKEIMPFSAKDAYIVMSAPRPPANDTVLQKEKISFRKKHGCVLNIKKPNQTVSF